MSAGHPSTPLRVLCYSHDSFGLGHFRRTLSVARAIVQRYANATVLCVTGSPCPELFELPPRTDYVKLPAVTKGPNGDYVARDLPARIAEIVDIRGQAILSVARSFRPDVVLVDHTATGIHDELLPMLEELRTRRPTVHVALGMRDIIDEPKRVVREFEQRRTLTVLDRFYDSILVYGHRAIFDVVAEYRLPEVIAHKVRYLGYACASFCSQDPQPSQRSGSEPKRLLATAGGGGDGFEMLRSLVEALTRRPLGDDLRSTVVTGPFMPKPDLEALRRAAGGAPVEVVRSTDQFEAWMEAADLVVGMGGYNTVTEALCLNKRLLVVPRRHPRQEQLERAQRLARLGLMHWMRAERALDPAQLAQALIAMAQIEPPDARARGLKFDGAQRAAELLADANAHRRGAAASVARAR